MLHENIKAARERAGLSLASAAERIGVGKTTLFRLEAGEAPIAAARLPVIARAYGTSVADLVDNTITDRPPEPDYRQVHAVVQMVEEIVHDLPMRPLPGRIAAVVVEVIKLTRDDDTNRMDGSYDPTRYAGIVRVLLDGKDAGRHQV